MAVILVVTFGLIGLNLLPVQAYPDVETPQITVQTSWGGATPFEIEKEIIERQEEALKGLRGLTKMESASYNSFGEITLSFELETVIEDALLRVSNKLNEVSGYPDNADRPVIEAAGANNSPVVWMVVKAQEGKDLNITHFMTFFEDSVRQNFERIKGVGSMFVLAAPRTSSMSSSIWRRWPGTKLPSISSPGLSRRPISPLPPGCRGWAGKLPDQDYRPVSDPGGGP